jgi:hypothetical protein
MINVLMGDVCGPPVGMVDALYREVGSPGYAG